MSKNMTTFQPIPASEIGPQIAAVLEPGEKVYWQAKPEKFKINYSLLIFLVFFGFLLAWASDVRDMGDIQAMLSEFGDSLKALWQQLPWAFLLFSMLPIGLIIAFWPRKRRYALTDRRVLSLSSGRIRAQVNPEQLMLLDTVRVRTGKRSKVGNVQWADADTYDRHNRKSHVQFRNVRDPDGVRKMLEGWMRLDQKARDDKATKSSESFRKTVGASGTAASPGQGAAAIGIAASSGDGVMSRGSGRDDSPAALGTQRIVHPQYGFSIDVPSSWDIKVQQHHDGPLRILGITLLKRVIRPGTPRPWDSQDERPWNKMSLSAGATVKLDISITPGAGKAMPSEEEVRNDRLGTLLGVSVESFEEDLDIHGFRGVGAVRELAAGQMLPAAAILRDWWLSGHDLHFEIQGVAAQESATLQETLDLVVGSLRPMD